MTSNTRSGLRLALQRAMSPSAIAVVGASPRSPWNRQILENIPRFGFTGEIAAVNPRYEEVSGIPCYPSLADIPFEPDAVVLAVGPDRVPGLVAEAGEAGAGGVVVFAGGFAEAGAEGAALQERAREAAAEADLALIGPNCQGLLNLRERCALYLDIVPGPLEPGSVALISQSGSVASSILNNQRGGRFSHVVTVGNEAVVEASDVMDALVDEPGVEGFALFLETIRSADRFVSACNRAERAGKRIVAIVSGRSEASRAAAASHSGALAPPDRLMDSLLRHLGVARVDSIEELIECSVLLGSRAAPGRRWGVLALSGGLGQLALDSTLPTACDPVELSGETRAALGKLLPPGAHTANPVDAWSPTDLKQHYSACLEAIAADPGVDTVVAVVDVPPEFPTTAPEITDDVLTAVADFSARTDKRLAVVAPLSGNVDPAVAARMDAVGVPVLSGLRQAARAIDIASTPIRTPQEPHPPSVEAERAAEHARSVTASRGGGAFSGLPAIEILERAGITTIETVPAATAADAVAASRRVGFPVVLKVADESLLHKSEHGGVRVGLGDEDAVQVAASEMIERTGPVLVQPQVRAGVELLLGIRSDRVLGSFVVAGIGGVNTELFDDVAVRPVGAGRDELKRMLGELRFARLLDGYRGAPRVDREAVVDALIRLDEFARAAASSLPEIDVNPLFASDRGVIAVDALLELQPEDA